uniref:Uncharacterized protein n=1 Tax=Rhizophora mucronata TaxID=61149 RepID=A0A2P2Q695_RHIMU
MVTGSPSFGLYLFIFLLRDVLVYLLESHFLHEVHWMPLDNVLDI